ncbi:MAG TPA: CBS domain-containing protein [Candidatus Dormibacteraeota bacterium]|jgi:predicted transcriptional regulator|nr:CBS domain-containing protein [Candidatus Dormibacteraeota bacterium]
MPDSQPAASDPTAITVADVMVANVLVVHSGDSIDDAVRLIVDSRITGVPVVDGEHHILGIVAESDVLGKRGVTVDDVMTGNVVTTEESTTLDAAAEIMLTRRIRRLPVVRDGRLVGILTRADLLRHVRHTHWTCDWCAATVVGLRRPNACPQCGGESWTFEVVPR